MRRKTALASMLACCCIVGTFIANAVQLPSGANWTGTLGSMASQKDTPSGLRMRFTLTAGATGTTTVSDGTNTTYMNAANGITTVPALPNGTNALTLVTYVQNCQAAHSTSLTCSGLGTMVIDFLDTAGNPVPIRNPRLHIARLAGNYASGTSGQTLYHGATLTLTTPGISLGAPTSASLAVIGNTIRHGALTTSTGTACTTSTTTSAGCGTVPLTGTTSQLSFSIGSLRHSTAVPWNINVSDPSIGDAYLITATFDEDFGDAPASFEPTGNPAASHLIGDLMLGAGVTAENTAVFNTGTLRPSPIASATASSDGNDDGAVFGNIIATAGSVHSQVVTLSGASRAGRICGWIDFNRNNVFNNPAERACTDFVAGATSAQLDWVVPVGSTAGTSFARLRASYDIVGVQNPTGLVHNGEVEDYQVNQVSQADLSITKTNNQTTYIPGQEVTYVIVASNAGPTAVAGAMVTDIFPAGMLTGVSWTCAAPGTGNSCPSSGTGNINASVNLAVGGTATFTVTGVVPATATGSLVNTAMVAVPAGFEDPTPGNNSSTDTDAQASPERCDILWGVRDGTSASGGNVLVSIDTTTGVVTRFPGLGLISASGGGDNISSLAIDPRNGRLFAVDNSNRQLRTLAPGATAWANTGVTVPGTSGANATPRLVMDGDGRLFVGTAAAGRDTAYRYAVSTGGVITGPTTVSIAFSGGSGSATGGDFAIDPQGNFYITMATGGNPYIYLASSSIYTGNTATATYVGATPVVGNGSLAGSAFMGGTLFWTTGTSTYGVWSGPPTGPFALLNSSGVPSIPDLASCAAAPPPTLTLQKTWVDAQVNDAVTVSVTDPPSTGTPLNAVANTASETDAGTPFNITRGTTYTLTEAFTTGSAAAYGKTLVCTGNSGTGAALDYTANALSGTLTVGSTADDIVCTFTNTRVPQPDFGVCDARMFLSQGPNATTNTSLYRVDNSTSPLTFPLIGQGTRVYNAAGYNPIDNYIYGISHEGGTGNQLLRIGADGSTVVLGVVSGLPNASWTSGTFSDAGVFYVLSGGGSTTLYTVDLVALTATSIPLSASVAAADFAWVGGLIYTVQANGQLASINPANGQVTNIGTPSGSANYGAMWGSPTGLFGNSNTGGFYRFDLATGARTLISTSPAATVNDGSTCPTAPIVFSSDLSITKDDGATTYAAGGMVVYTIVVGNGGPFGAQGVSVNDPLPSGITDATWTCTGAGGGTCGAASGTGAINDTGVNLPVGATVTYLLTLQVSAERTGDLVNTATVTPGPATSDPDPSNNSATDTNTQQDQTDLSVTKASSTDVLLAGETVTYTITVLNGGPSPANGAVVRDDWTTQPGLDCSTAAGGVLACPSATNGAACPGPLTPEALQAGLAITPLPNGGQIVLSLTCRIIAPP